MENGYMIALHISILKDADGIKSIFSMGKLWKVSLFFHIV